MSPRTPTTLLPRTFNASSSSFWRRPVIKTNAPSSTKRFAMAKPIPAVPPVITAIFPCNLLMSVIQPLPGPLGGFPAICRVVPDDMSNGREWKMKAHHHEPISRNTVQDGLARLDRLRGIVVEDGRPLGALQARHRVMGDVTHMHELFVARGEQDCGMERRMSRRRHIMRTACNFTALLHKPGSIGDRRQVLCRGNGALLERVGQRRTVDLAFITTAGPVVPLHIDKDELSVRKRQRARFRHQAADMVQVTVRDHDHIYALWRHSGPPQVRLEAGKAAEGWSDFLTKAGIDEDTLPSRVDHQRVVRDLDHRLHEVCLQHRSELSFRGIHSEDRPDRNLPIAIGDHGRLEVADLEAIEAIAV